MVKNGYDLIVIGAGPAGLTAAKFAAENGLSVALLERKEVLHDVLRMCGMMLVTLSGNYMGERLIYNEEQKLFSFPHHGFSVKYDGPAKDFYSWEIYLSRRRKDQVRRLFDQRPEGKSRKSHSGL